MRIVSKTLLDFAHDVAHRTTITLRKVFCKMLKKCRQTWLACEHEHGDVVFIKSDAVKRAWAIERRASEQLQQQRTSHARASDLPFGKSLSNVTLFTHAINGT